ncbi:monovalent cation/H+ antiporter subunit D family protein [Natrinema gari]|uniref:NADH/Ubiquinone/plastoquinone n=1 Tax=Natrinema gari JCM 14663 TaxID=1230459 RepID=L9ZCY9_9EURY|nr:monovalent cation/H+ antiporter subunit D family protein [Natrinema gari]ELY83003.1 NADH/Ubiquinone/plastoquinone [Natrinema gari JCM 14663]
MSSVDLLLPLLIAVPILAATLPIALGLWVDRTGWPVAALTTSALFAGAIALASVVSTRGEAVTHTLGDYPRTYGIELVADQFSILIVLLVTAVATGVLVYTRQGGPRGNTFYTAYLLLTAGLLGISLTGDVFNLFVFLEITSLATYALVASGDGPEAAVASLKYLILGTIAASMYLIGVAFVFMATGTLNMLELAEAIPGAESQTLLHTGVAFIVVGFAVKVAQWPLHTWQPSAYQQAPDGVTPLIAALVSTASAYAFGRLLVTVFGVEYLTAMPNAAAVVLTIGCVSVLAGTILAVIQTEVKRMLAYSSVSQFGLVIAAYGVVIAGSSETAFIGAAIHLVGHGLVKAGLFLGVALVARSYDARTVDEYAGLAKSRPIVAGAIAVLLLSLVGVPPGVGFVGKWYIALGAVQSELWPVAAVIFLSTMLTLAYAARLLEKMYFTPPARADPLHAPAPVATDGGNAGSDESDAEPTRDEPGAAIAAIRGDRSAAPVSTGMVAIVVLAAIGAVALGFSGGTIAELLDPFLTKVIN